MTTSQPVSMTGSQPLDVEVVVPPSRTKSTLFQAVASRSGIMLMNNGAGDKDQPAGQTTTLQATSTIVTTIIGAGILSFPRTFAQGGWFYSSLLLVLCAWSVVEMGVSIDASCQFVQNRLRRGEEYSFTRVTTYDDLCEAAFGRLGKIMAAISVNLFLLMLGAVFIILISLQLKFLLQPIDLGDWAVWGIGFVFMPLSLVDDMTIIAKISVIGVFASFIYAISIGTAGWQAAQHPCPAEYTNLLPLSDLGNLGPVISIFLMGFAYQTVAPNVRAEMQNPEEFPRAVGGGVSVVGLVYASSGALAYWGWGNDVKGSVVDSMYEFTDTCEQGERLPLGLLLASAIIANLTVTFPIVMNCVFRAAEAALGVKYSIKGASVFIRIGLVALALVIGQNLPYFFPFLSLTGATVGGFVCVFLPIALYWKLGRDEGISLRTYKGTAAKHAFILLLGIVSLIFGTIGAIQEFIDEMEKAP